VKWSLVYEKAIRSDGSLLFPERLTKEFLDSARRTMGSYLFANQYQNEVIPDDEKTFKPHWLRYYKELPENTYRFGFIDPAIGQLKHHDYTGISVIDVDTDGIWYLRLACRLRLTPTEIVDKMFELFAQFQLKGLGVEAVAYQEALLYILSEKMRREKKILPVTGIKRNQTSKQTRILGLVPRFEWGRLLVSQGMVDFEDEYNSFPRGSHDDILDSLASLEEIVFYPQKEKEKIEKPHSPHDPNYEKWYIRNLIERQQRGED
jgi:predicted phage terminase large subunit-like protein